MDLTLWDRHCTTLKERIRENEVPITPKRSPTGHAQGRDVDEYGHSLRAVPSSRSHAHARRGSDASAYRPTSARSGDRERERESSSSHLSSSRDRDRKEKEKKEKKPKKEVCVPRSPRHRPHVPHSALAPRRALRIDESRHGRRRGRQRRLELRR